MKKQLKISFFFTVFATIGLGLVYPLVATVFGFLIPPLSRPAMFSQKNPKETEFHGRPSMSGGPYSGASNLSLTSLELRKQLEERLKEIKKYPPTGGAIPYDLLFASASGYDPHISPQAAFYQISRIAQTTGLDMGLLKRLVDRHVQHKLWGFIGAEMVNVDELNKDLHRLIAKLKGPAEHRIFRIEQ